MCDLQFHHFVDRSPGCQVPLAALGKQNLRIGVLQGRCGIRDDHRDLLTIVVDEFIVILRLRRLHLGQTTQVAGSPRQIHKLLQLGALDFARHKQEFATEVAQGLTCQITTLLRILRSQHELPQGVLQNLCRGIQGHGLVRMEHQRQNEGVIGKRGFRRIESRIGNRHATGLQRQIVVGIVLSHVLVFESNHRLVLFIGVDIQLHQTGTRFDDQRQNAVRDVIRHRIGREHAVGRRSHLVITQLQILAGHRNRSHDVLLHGKTSDGFVQSGLLGRTQDGVDSLNDAQKEDASNDLDQPGRKPTN